MGRAGTGTPVVTAKTKSAPKFRDLSELREMLIAADLMDDVPQYESHEWMSAAQMAKSREVLEPHGVPTSEAPGEMHAFPLVTGGRLSIVCGATTLSTADTVEIAFLRISLFGAVSMFLHKGRHGWDETGEVRGFCTFADVLDETAAFVARQKAERAQS